MWMIARNKSPKIVISGYYGFDNCGDEAVLLAMLHCLRLLYPDAKITVLSGNPEKTREIYGVKAVSRWSPVKIAREILSCRLLISGGGSLLQDVTSSRSPSYYLGVIRMALFLRKRVMIYSQGVGPLTGEKNRAMVAKTLNRCHEITLRDAHSAELLKELGVTRDMQVTCDPVMALRREDVINAEFANEKWKDQLNPDKPLLMVAIRCWKDDSHIAPVARLLDIQVENGWNVLLVPAHFPDDMEAIAKLRNHMAAKPFCIDKSLHANEFLSLAALADRVFSMRLHGLICAMAMGTTMLGLSYDPKVSAFMHQAGLADYCLSVDNFDLDLAKHMIERLDVLTQQSRESMEARRIEMRQMAWRTAELAARLF